jgi:hypothetical protein
MRRLEEQDVSKTDIITAIAIKAFFILVFFGSITNIFINVKICGFGMVIGNSVEIITDFSDLYIINSYLKLAKKKI